MLNPDIPPLLIALTALLVLLLMVATYVPRGLLRRAVPPPQADTKPSRERMSASEAAGRDGSLMSPPTAVKRRRSRCPSPAAAGPHLSSPPCSPPALRPDTPVEAESPSKALAAAPPPPPAAAEGEAPATEPPTPPPPPPPPPASPRQHGAPTSETLQRHFPDTSPRQPALSSSPISSLPPGLGVGPALAASQSPAAAPPVPEAAAAEEACGGGGKRMYNVSFLLSLRASNTAMPEQLQRRLDALAAAEKPKLEHASSPLATSRTFPRPFLEPSCRSTSHRVSG